MADTPWIDRLRGALANAPSASNPYPMVRVVDDLCDHIVATGNRQVAPQLYDMLRGSCPAENILGYIERKVGPLERTDGGAT